LISNGLRFFIKLGPILKINSQYAIKIPKTGYIDDIKGNDDITGWELLSNL
jgi:hypothetical protein